MNGRTPAEARGLIRDTIAMVALAAAVLWCAYLVRDALLMIMSRQVGVSAVTVIVALLIGGSLAGILGAILAVPTAAVLQVVAAEALREK